MKNNAGLAGTASAIFAVSLAAFLYEVLLVRLFGVLFRSEFLFLMISIAVAGLSAGAVCRQLLYRGNASERLVDWILLLFPASFPAILMLIVRFFGSLKMAGATALAVVPFIFSGFLLSHLYAAQSRKSGFIYFADLLGGASGCLLSVALAYFFDVPTALAFIPVAAAAAILFLRRKSLPVRLAPTALALVFAGYAFWAGPFDLDGEALKAADTPLGQTLTYPKITAKWFKSTWGIYSRCDLVMCSSSGMLKSIFLNGGTQAEMIKSSTDSEILKYIRKDVTFFPYLFGKNDKILVVGSGGGRDVFMALEAGAGQVDAVEINRGVIDLVEEEKDFTGDIYGRDNVRLFVEDGRSYLMRSNESYDQIVLSLTSTFAFSDVSALGQQENYLYTKDAFELLFDRLKPGGRIVMFLDYRELLEKFILSAVSVLGDRGMQPPNAMNGIVAFASEKWTGYRYGLIIGESPFDLATADAMFDAMGEFGIAPWHIPHYGSDGDLSKLASGELTPEQYIENSGLNLHPSTDDNPYFLEVVLNVRRQLYLMASVLLAGILVVSAGGYSQIRKRLHSERAEGEGAFERKNRAALGRIAVFILCGCAFFMVEIALTKRFSFYLGLPHLNISVVLFSILMGMGLGGATAGSMKRQGSKKLFAISAALAVLILCVWAATPLFIKATIGWSLPARCAIFAVYNFPLAFLLGMPFPLALAWSVDSFENEIPWFWAINALAGVLGSVFSVMLAMIWGFSAVFAAASLLYAAISIIAVLSSAKKVNF